MKQFFIIRHAKSSWSDLNLKDIDRPLNKRGLHDAPKMADYLQKRPKVAIEHIYSSPANRALSTAKIFHEKLQISNEIDVRSDLYHAIVEDILYIIKNTDISINSFAVFGHNPGFTHLVNHFAQLNIDNLPTCGIAHFEADIKKWEDLHPSNSNLIELMFPKKLIY